MSGSIYVIYMLFTQEESVIEEKSYYDLNLFSLENGLMTYKDSLYKVSTGIKIGINIRIKILLNLTFLLIPQ